MHNKASNAKGEYVPQVRPIEFTRMSRGQIRLEGVVEAYVTKAGMGKGWNFGNYIKAIFT